MPAIIIPSRTRRQPQGPVAVDWRNPLARGLSFAASPSTGVVASPDAVSGVLPESLGTNVSITGTTAGRALTFSNGGNLDFPTRLKPLEGASKLTVDCLIYLPDNPGTDVHIFGQWTTLVSWLFLRRNNRFAFAWGQTPASGAAGGAYESNIAQGGISNNKWTHVAFVWDAATGRYDFYFDGASPGASNNWFGSLPLAIQATTDPVRLGGNAAFTGSIATVRTWKRALSATEVADLASNPWQLFRARRPIIYSLPAATTPVGGVFLRQRWKRQPQGPVAVDWGNPLARGLIVAFNGSSPYRNLATQDPIVENDPAFPGKRLATRFGIGYWTDFGTSNGSTQLLQVTASASKVPAQQFIAVTLGYKKSDSTLRQSSAFGTNDTSVANFNAHLPWDDGVVYWDWGGSRVTASGLTFGDDVWTFQNNPTGLQIVQNGVSRAQGTTSPTRSPGAGPLWIGRGLSSPDAAITSFFYVHARALADAEWKALHENPWQLFRPAISGRIFFFPTAYTFSRPNSDVVFRGWTRTPY